MRTYTVGPPEPAEIDTLCAMGSWAFANSAPAEMLPWVERIGQENMRVVREGKQAVGNLGIVWMGQWFGGRSVPMAGIAAVSVAPDRRGYGAASHLMTSALREIRAKGIPLSALYPATQPVYRSVGYDLAGSRHEIRLPAVEVEMKDRTLDVNPLTTADREAMLETYATRARISNGNLDRVEFSWDRIHRPKGEAPKAFKITRNGRMEGYVFLTKTLVERNNADFNVLDMVALTPEAGRRILTLFADHKSLAHEFVFHGTPYDPFWMLLREQAWTSRIHFHWMLRLVDVPRALEARGYPSHVTSEVHFAVKDPLFPENEAPFVLEVADGRGQIRSGGRGSFQIDIRGMAPLYSGFLSPEEITRTGLLSASPGDLAAAAPIFAGPSPWMPDMF